MAMFVTRAGSAQTPGLNGSTVLSYSVARGTKSAGKNNETRFIPTTTIAKANTTYETMFCFSILITNL